MFNSGGFNQMPFNVMHSLEVYASFEIDHDLESVINISMNYSLKFEIDHSGDMEFTALRERVGSFLMDLASEMVFSGTREKLAKFDIDCNLDMSFDGTRYRIETIEYTGDFAAGDKIVIDTDKLKIMQNNQNAMHLMQGDFFDLNAGNNQLTYIDEESGRTVRIRFTHRDRFV